MRVVAVIILLALIATVGFLGVGLANPEFSYGTEVLVDAPVEKSFAVFRDPQTLGIWLSGFVSIEYLRGEPEQVGSFYRLTFEEDGRRTLVTEEITGLVENDSFSVTLDSPMMLADVSTRFSAQGRGTRITTASTVRGKGIFYRAMLYLMRTSMADRQRADLNRLQRLIETSD